MDSTQRPLELILARNLLTSISTPSFLVDGEGTMVFYNEACAAMVGRSFEETGQLTAEAWTSTFGPFDDEGEALTFDDLSLTKAVVSGRPAHGEFCIKTRDNALKPIEAAAFPLVANEQGASGAMILFWPRALNGADAE